MRHWIAVFLLLVVASVYAQEAETERVLVPLSVNDVHGVNGSIWTTELWIVNRSADQIIIERLPCQVSSSGCRDGVRILARSSVRMSPLGTAEAPGVLLRAPVGVSYTLHVRDLSRQAESWGTEIPVVREKDFFVGSESMTNIPFGAQYRHTLRIYSIAQEGVGGNFRVTLHGVNGTEEDELLREEVVVLEPAPPPPPDRIGSPLSQITITNLFTVEKPGAFERVRVTIEPEDKPALPYFAFVSVTNNATQHVTTATPR